MTPTLTIVVPVYNRQDILSPTLNSIFNQTYRPLHLIIVDNNSTDRTAAVAREWADSHRSPSFAVTVASETTPGAAAARHKGLSLTTSPYIAFFDSDDIMSPSTAQAFMEAFASHPQAQLIIGETETVHPDGSTQRRGHRKGNLLINQIHHCSLCSESFAAKTDYVRQCGSWNSSLRIWDDWELGIRLLLPSPVTVEIPDTLSKIIHHEASITGTTYSSRPPHTYLEAISAAYAAILDSGHPLTSRLLTLMYYRRVLLAALFRREGSDNRSAAHTLRKQAMRDLASDSNIRPFTRLKARLILPLAYLYTRLGLRGAASLVTPLLH